MKFVFVMFFDLDIFVFDEFMVGMDVMVWWWFWDVMCVDVDVGCIIVFVIYYFEEVE